MDDMVVFIVLLAIVIYGAFTRFVTLMLSGKWHPDGNPNRYDP